MPSTQKVPLQWGFVSNILSAADKVSAASLDANQATLRAVINQLIDDLGQVVRSDNLLSDSIVTLRTLGSDTLAAIAGAGGWQPKTAVACASTANLTLSGEQTIDGVVTSASRVLVKDQSTASQNGIYVTAAGAWTRAADATTAGQLGYAFVTVLGGIANRNTNWVVTATAAALVVGVSSISWARFGSTSPSSSIFNAIAAGAAADGVHDDTVYLQAAINSAHAAGARVVYIPAGRYLVSSTITVPSGLVLRGDGMGLTVIVVAASMVLTAAVFQNQNLPIAGARVDSNIAFEKFSVDGSARQYPAYLSDPGTGLPISNPAVNSTRNPAYSTTGGIIQMNAVDGLRFSEVEIYGHQCFGILDKGGRNVLFERCRFHGNGKVDNDSNPIWTQSYGNVAIITAITKANPAVVTLDSASPVSNGQQIIIAGVRGLSHIPDGTYTVAGVSGSSFNLVGVDTSADSGFVYTGNQTAVQTFFVPSEDVKVANCEFYDNIRSAMTFSPRRGGLVTGCTFRNNGESTIFSSRGHGISIVANRFFKSTLTDIAAMFVEANGCTDFSVSDNHFEESQRAAVAFLGVMGGRITGNTMRNIVTGAGLTYPYGPEAEGWTGSAIGVSVAGTAIDEKAYIMLQSLGSQPCADIIVSHNVMIDDRDTPLTTRGVWLTKSGVDNLVYDVIIADNDFRRSGLADANMVSMPTPNTALVHTLSMRGNVGHSSENPVVLTGTIDTSATGLLDLIFGFTPRMVYIKAFEVSVVKIRASESWIARDRTNLTNGTLGYGVVSSLENLATTPVTDQTVLDRDAYRLIDGSGAIVDLAEFQQWLINGLKINVQTAGGPVHYVAVGYP